MKAMQINKADQGPGLILAEVQKPEPGPGEILIRVHAAGVTLTELLWYPTTHTKSGTARMRTVPGHEFSGVITGADHVRLSKQGLCCNVDDDLSISAFLADCSTVRGRSLAQRNGGFDECSKTSSVKLLSDFN